MVELERVVSHAEQTERGHTESWHSAMRDGDRKPATFHPAEEQRWRALDLHQDEARLELLRHVAHEVREVLRARNQLAQIIR